jgi:hypothetical protein
MSEKLNQPTNMNTEEIKFRPFLTSSNETVFRADFADCTLELNTDKDHLWVIDADGNSEEWELQDGAWIYTNGNMGQKPTLNWPDNYYAFVEASINALG